MTWPSQTPIPTGNVDQGTDDPSQARSDLYALMVRFNELLTAVVEGETVLTEERLTLTEAAMKNEGNTFLALQTITNNGIQLRLNSNGTGTLNALTFMRQSINQWALQLQQTSNDLWLTDGTNPKIQVARLAQLLALTETDITYGGQSLLNFFSFVDSTFYIGQGLYGPLSHTLGKVPSYMSAIRMECAVADGGYSPGDVIHVHGNIGAAMAFHSATASQIQLSLRGAMSLPTKNGSGVFTPSTANSWLLRVIVA